jgi:hypothetical protein
VDALERECGKGSMRTAVVLGTLLALAASGCGSSNKPRGQPPQRIVRGFYSCPAEAPTLVIDGLFYPATYPRRPAPSVRPSRCLRTSDDAAKAGFRRAPTPRHDIRIDELYLVPAQRGLRRYCRTLSARARLPVPCPTLVPAPNDSVVDCGGAAPCATPGRVVLEGNFVGPPGYVGSGEGAGHLWFFASTSGQRYLIECSKPHDLAGRVDILGERAHWLACPPGSELNSGHLLLEWRLHDLVYAVSVHGVSRLNRRLAVVLARHLRIVH